MTKLEKIFCFIGGADLRILKKCPYDVNKFIAIGIGVLNTVVLSMCTMGFAMYSVAKHLNPILLVFFSVFWGFIIFGIDWGLISTIHKKKKYDIKSGSVLFGATLFRVLVAITISFTVSKPLEVLVFEDYLPVAKREMQNDYLNRLNSLNIKAENAAESFLSNVENAIVGITDEKQQAYRNDPFVKQLLEDKNSLQEQYTNLSSKFQKLDSESFRKIASAQGSINRIQNRIDQIKGENSELSENKQQEILKLENSMVPFYGIRRFENGEIRKRGAELSSLNSKIVAKQKEIDSRYTDIGKDFDSKKDDLKSQKERLAAYKDSISLVAKNEYIKNAETSDVFKLDNLINNIISIGYIEKWHSDPEAGFGEKEIAKKVSFISWLLVILIMIIDTAPIVIKLLVRRGCYEEEKERIEIDNQIKLQAHAIAFSKTYPEYAEKVVRYETKLNEIRALAKAKNEFNVVIDEIREKSIDNIHKMIKSFHKIDSPSIKKLLTEFQKKLETQLDVTKDKMFEIYNHFINSLKP